MNHSSGLVSETEYWPYQKEINDKSLKIAFITLILPGLPGKSGGEIRDGHILGYLSAHHHVDVFSINNFPKSENLNKIISQIDNIYHPEQICIDYPHLVNGYVNQGYSEKLRARLARAGVFIPYGKYPFEVEGFMSTFNLYIKNLLQEKINKDNYDLLFVTPQLNPVYLSDIQIPKSCKCVFATYDVEKIRYNRLKKTHRSLLTKLTFPFEEKKAIRMEKNIINNIDGIIAVSELDRQTFIKEYHVEPSKILNLENGVDTSYFSNSFELNSGTNIVYVGNMGYPPNSQAVDFFVKDIMPIIERSIPDAVFWAVGANASPELKNQDNGKNIRVTGEVPDVRKYLNIAGVVCIPLLTGSGTKYKVLEALSSGKPVITTSIGAEGIDVKDGEHLMIRNTAAKIAEAVVFCLKNQSKTESMAKCGRDFVVNHHEWKVILPKIDDWITNNILV